MKIRFKGLKNILLREIRIISKDINIISVLLLAPVFYSLFYGAIYFNKLETKVPVAVVNSDGSLTAQRLIRYFDSHQTLRVEQQATSLQEARILLENGVVHGIICFPQKFESKLKRSESADLEVYLDASRFLVSNDLNKSINEVIGYVNAGITLKYIEATGLNPGQAIKAVDPVTTDIRNLFNTTNSYGDFIIPGILVLILQQTLLMGLAESFAKERETNSLSELFAGANNSTFALIHGKGLFYLVLYSSYAALFFTMNYSVFKLPFRGDSLTLVLLTFLFLSTVIYFTFFIASFFKRKIIALQFLTLTSYPVFLISGYSWPLDSMPEIIKVIAGFIPSTPYFQAYIRVTQMGAGFHNVMPEFYHLAALTVCSYLLVVIRLKTINKNKL